MDTIREILKRLGGEFGISHYAAIGVLIGVSKSTMDNWKRRGNIPYGALVTLWLREPFDLIYVLTGQRDGRWEVERESLQLQLELAGSELATAMQRYELARRQVAEVLGEQETAKLFPEPPTWQVSEVHAPPPERVPRVPGAVAEKRVKSPD
ncbi:MAG: helix-turn-helix domain-containing protein [Candidatus Marinimicrobia bacterium]|nr:helix-turn-helix domain-containing protein [Candidatus Neomarinimicrobiota bacterium]